MRQFLYLTPYFPPLARVGALRPLRFTRHLPQRGWRPVVLCDLRPGERVESKLAAAIPRDVHVSRDFSSRARGMAARWRAGRLPGRRRTSVTRIRPGLLHNPELVPLGEYGPSIPHAYRAGQRLLHRHACDAILVNADPHAGIVVGACLSRWSGLPFVMDLRDPWALCDLRRPLRPAPVRTLVDRMERALVERAAKVVLNTRTATAVYSDRYVDVESERFTYIRNSGDPSLCAGIRHTDFDRFTILLLGSLRRFLDARQVIEALGILRRRGVGSGDLQLVVTGDWRASTLQHARDAGVIDMLRTHALVPYGEISSIMHAADLLLLIDQGSQLRIPSKFYDYACAQRPMLLVSENRELRELQSRLPGSTAVSARAPDAIAEAIQAALDSGRGRSFPRDATGLDAATAATRMAAVLDEVAGG